MNNVYLEIDATDVIRETQRLSTVLKPEQVNKAMGRVFRRTGKHVRKVLKTEIPKKYEVKAGEVGNSVRSPKVYNSGLDTGCIIPVVGPRKSIGGKGATRGFPASGGAHGWASLRRKYRVKSKIVKGYRSTLPSYGGMPPFRNLSAPTLNGVTFTREGRDRFPIKKVSGIAIPQMPTNRSADDIQNDIKDFMFQRMEHEINFMIGGR